MKKLRNTILALALCLLISSCSQKLQSEIKAGVKPEQLQSFYVVHFSPDRRNLHQIIASQLLEMGFKATSGEKHNVPNDVHAIVTYIDNWQWDLTNYMIKIQIDFKKPNGELLASATSYRTSLVRKNPPEMIKETLDEIFNPRKHSE